MDPMQFQQAQAAYEIAQRWNPALYPLSFVLLSPREQFAWLMVAKASTSREASVHG